MQHPDGSHTNVGEEGNVTHGDDNFNKATSSVGSSNGWLWGALGVVGVGLAIAAAPETGGASLAPILAF